MGELFDLRIANDGDAKAIRDIYNHYVHNSTCTFDLQPETLEQRSRWLLSRNERQPVIVCLTEATVIGWGSLSAWHDRAAYDRTAEVSFYIHHLWHRRGLGRMLLTNLVDRAMQLQYRALIGRACAEQVASIKLQESLGFREVGRLIEVGYKFDRWLDVVYLQRLLG